MDDNLSIAVRTNLQTARKRMGRCQDCIAEILAGTPDDQVPSRIQGVISEIQNAGDYAVQALRFYAEQQQRKDAKWYTITSDSTTRIALDGVTGADIDAGTTAGRRRTSMD